MNSELEKLSDTQAEAGIIATLVYHPDFILHSDVLKAGYFYHKDNGCLYWAIDELIKAGVDNIDAFNISNMLQSNNAVKKTLESVNMPDMDEFIELCSDAARHTIAEYQLLVMLKRVENLKNSDTQSKPMLKLNPEKTNFYDMAIEDFSMENYDPIVPQLKLELGI